MTWNITGKHVLITGGTSGIGRATAARLASRGANVTITSRSLTTARTVADELTAAAGTAVEPAALDLSSLDSVRTFAQSYRDRHQRLDILINNAGTMAGKRRTTPDGLEWTLAVNHLGPFLLTDLLTPLLLASTRSRVITVSSETHRSAKRGLDFDDLQMTTGYSPSKAYAASKLANILFTIELDNRLGPRGRHRPSPAPRRRRHQLRQGHQQPTLDGPRHDPPQTLLGHPGQGRSHQRPPGHRPTRRTRCRHLLGIRQAQTTQRIRPGRRRRPPALGRFRRAGRLHRVTPVAPSCINEASAPDDHH